MNDHEFHGKLIFPTPSSGSLIPLVYPRPKAVHHVCPEPERSAMQSLDHFIEIDQASACRGEQHTRSSGNLQTKFPAQSAAFLVVNNQGGVGTVEPRETDGRRLTGIDAAGFGQKRGIGHDLNPRIGLLEKIRQRFWRVRMAAFSMHRRRNDDPAIQRPQQIQFANLRQSPPMPTTRRHPK